MAEEEKQVEPSEEKAPASDESTADKKPAEEMKKPKLEPKPEPKVADKAEDKKVDPEKSADADNGVKVPAKFKKLVDEIGEMSIMELAELVKVLEKKFGVSPMAAVAAAPVNDGGDPAAAGEEKTEFAIELKAAGGQKIQVIKVVREMIGKGLKEAKDLVDDAPKVLRENVKKEEAEELKKKLEEAGATVELK